MGERLAATYLGGFDALLVIERKTEGRRNLRVVTDFILHEMMKKSRFGLFFLREHLVA